MAGITSLVHLVQALTDNKKTKQVSDSIKNAKVSTAKVSLKTLNKDLVLQFPMLFSENISMDTMIMVANAFETEYCYLLLNVLSNQVIRDGEQNAADTLKQFHQNINRTYYTEDQYFDSCNEYSSKPISESLNLGTLNMLTMPKFMLEADKTSTSNVNSVEVNDKDVKKINGISPLKVKATLNYKQDNQIIKHDILFGIKSMVHKLKAKDICYYLGTSSKSSNLLAQLIRWTTGEIKLFKDIIFCTDYQKKLAKQNFDQESFWWAKLSALADENKTKGMLGKKQAMAVATMVISKSDVDAIKQAYGFDILTNTVFTSKICDNFSLLNFVVVDEASEIIKIYDEVNHCYEVYPFRALKSSEKRSITIDDVNAFKSVFGR